MYSPMMIRIFSIAAALLIAAACGSPEPTIPTQSAIDVSDTETFRVSPSIAPPADPSAQSLADLDWNLADYGGASPSADEEQPARFTISNDVFRGAPSALGIHSNDPRSAVLISEPIPVNPETTYTFVGFVQVEDLEPLTAQIYGTFILEMRDRNGVSTWSGGTSHAGSSDEWFREIVSVTTDSEAMEILVHAVLAGTGTASGSAYFDDMVLIEHSENQALAPAALDRLLAAREESSLPPVSLDLE